MGTALAAHFKARTLQAALISAHRSDVTPIRSASSAGGQPWRNNFCPLA
jgi:hypothetical protein